MRRVLGLVPDRLQMDYGPRKLFMMIRAGMKEAVLSANTMWNCTSCYRCVVRCPRAIPVTDILQDLATKAVELGYARQEDTTRFSKSFWWSTHQFGRTDERLVTTRYYFSFGPKDGILKALANLKIAWGLIRTGRMHIGAPKKIRDTKGLQAILAKAQESAERDGGS